MKESILEAALVFSSLEGHMQRAALLSVSDTSGLEEFAKCLVDHGYMLLATTGTGKFLKDNGIPFTTVEEFTGQKEILGGRVKTLHPKIHAGILANRHNPEHMAQLQELGYAQIDFVVVNLYPFLKSVKVAGTKSLSEMIELVDIGGPTMLRAASKNFSGVLPVIDPNDYPEVIGALRKHKDALSLPFSLRKALAVKVFTVLAQDNLAVASYLSSCSDDNGRYQHEEFPMLVGGIMEREQPLRYGENPHQQAALYKFIGASEPIWKQLQGKELSYNNMLDTDAALNLIRSFSHAGPTAAIFKHLNPCGLATSASLLDALKLAKRGDPRSHFGGIIAVNRTVNAEVTSEIVEDFAEIVIAPSYDDEALEILKTRKNLRVLTYETLLAPQQESRSTLGGMLIQTCDPGVSRVSEAKLVSNRKPSESEMEDLQFAWTICAQVKSNAIVVAKHQMLQSVGAGQMSRVDSTEIAISKANTHGHDLNGSVAASDAFFPFPDSVEALARAGVVAIIAPGGAKRDGEAIEAANRLNVSLLFASDRHFRH